jgi:hypothetical protein
MILSKILLVWFTVTGALLIFYAWRGIIAAWREPVLKHPVLIIESDDWGAGPVEQADALKQISHLLEKFADRDRRRPVMTLGMILAVADGEKTLSSGDYHRQQISSRTHGPLLNAIKSGIESGVFSLQLHGMEHYWPPALLLASKTDKTVMDWLAHAPQLSTEELPSPLQSRWVDASILPSRHLSANAVQLAAKEEVAAFQQIFGTVPRVAVPPTFIWTEDVEKAWAAAGVTVVITPGNRFESRDESGRPAGNGRAIHNGQSSENNRIVYLVRDDYFEPSLGHTAVQAIGRLSAKTRLGRPTLYEMHRFNFLGSEKKRNRALEELECLLGEVLKQYPDLAFLSSIELATILKGQDPAWLEQWSRRRIHMWLSRLGELPRLRKFGWLTGWIVPAGLLWGLTR